VLEITEARAMSTSFATRSAVYTGGQWHAGEGDSLTVLNPVNGATVASLNAASPRQVRQAVAAAREALAGWRNTDASERGRWLARIASAVEAHRSSLVETLQLNNGKPLTEARQDIDDVAATFAYYAQLCEEGTQVRAADVALPGTQHRAECQPVPVGVAGLIVPWNFPMVTTAWKLAPALAAGCTVVLKPSELTPLPELALMALLHDIGLPAGVVNPVCGAAEVGAALVDHPDVAKISFTGSNATGQRILQACGRRMQRVSLELGGKSSLIVLDDAALDDAVALAIGGAFYNAGQMCSATSRILVAQRLYPRFLDAFVEASRALRHGEPTDPTVTLGPLISAGHCDNVIARIVHGVQDGARLVSGGNPIGHPGGFAIAPAVYADVPLTSRLWREEIFGPVACVRSVDGDDEAIALANDSEFGLVATVVSGDAQRAARVAAQLEVGTVWINAPQVIYPQTAWGGFKHSGWGRELGPSGLQAFQELRHVVRPS
jgi:betaine-aldehyde dehydrogenase